MAKYTPTPVAASTLVSIATGVNQNLQDISTAIENTVSRDGSNPNSMNADLDMNSNQILNLPTPVDPGDPIRLQDAPMFKGDKGDKGDTGITGPAGPSNELTIGTVTDGGAAGATITGISPNQVLNLVLPQGPQGIQGVQGPAGTNGADGSKWYSDNVAPSSGLGDVGDWFINTTTGDVSEKTDSTTWTFRLNLATSSGGSIPVGAIMFFEMTTAPIGWLKANGALLERSSYPELDAAIYCGDANNATAEWGYRTNSTDTVRSTTGTHIRLRDYRGEFIRGWDDGRGIDSGRSFWASQADEYRSHNHSINDLGHTHQFVGGNGSAGNTYAVGQTANSYLLNTTSSSTGISLNNSGGTETRPRNQAALVCIKY